MSTCTPETEGRDCDFPVVAGRDVSIDGDVWPGSPYEKHLAVEHAAPGPEGHHHAECDFPGGGRGRVCILSTSASGAAIEYPAGPRGFKPWDSLTVEASRGDVT